MLQTEVSIPSPTSYCGGSSIAYLHVLLPNPTFQLYEIWKVLCYIRCCSQYGTYAAHGALRGFPEYYPRFIILQFLIGLNVYNNLEKQIFLENLGSQWRSIRHYRLKSKMGLHGIRLALFHIHFQHSKLLTCKYSTSGALQYLSLAVLTFFCPTDRSNTINQFLATSMNWTRADWKLKKFDRLLWCKS